MCESALAGSTGTTNYKFAYQKKKEEAPENNLISYKFRNIYPK